ncbi:hypothetical protein CRYUN_Cryun02cG0129000 [Craigia yunnanensis]
MESFESEEPEKKRPHLDFPAMVRNSSSSPNHAKSLVDDLILLGIRAGGGHSALEILDHTDKSRGSIPSCPVEEMFLCRLLEKDFLDSSGDDGFAIYVGQVLSSCHSSTRELIKSLEDTISAERVKTESMALSLYGKLSVEDTIMQLSKIDDMMKEESKNLHDVIDTLHLKHKEYDDGIQTYISSHSTDQSEIKRLQGYVTKQVLQIVAADRLSELQDGQEQNLIYLKQLKDLQNELKDDKFIQSSRLYTLLNDQLQHWNAEMEQYKALTDALQSDRFLVMRREKEEKELNIKAESADVARNTIDNADSRVEELELELQKCFIERNDLEIKMEEAIQDAGRNNIKAEFRVMASALSKEMGMMEGQLNCWKETAHEAISLHEEAQVLKALLSDKTNQQKRLAEECAEQIVEIKSLNDLIEKLQKEKMEMQIFLDMYGQEGYDNRNVTEIRESENRAHSQAEVLKNALDEHSLELRVKAANEAEAACQERLSVAEAEIAELRAKMDAFERCYLQRPKAAATFRRMSCETKFVAIRKSEEFVLVVPSEDPSSVELIRPVNEIKPIVIVDSSSIDFIISSELKDKTIGQAYEDMRTQNQHLLQQMTQRDDYNIKLVSESVKTKQAHSFFLSEKQTLARQLKQVNSSIEPVKMRIAQSEEQMKVCLTDAIKFTQEDRHFMISLETAKWELADAEELKGLNLLQHLLRRIMSISCGRSQGKKLEEELSELNSKVAELSSETGKTAIQKLQDEIKNCKNILKCGVCFDRPKEGRMLCWPVFFSNLFLIMCICILYFTSFICFTLAGCNCEMLSSILQSMYTKKFRDTP